MFPGNWPRLRCAVYPYAFLIFGGTGLNTATGDFDGDGISDKNEVASWVFPTNHINGGAILASDIASIGARKAMQPEVHKDTDKGGVDDGDEDVNKNGIRDAGETDPFDPSDDKKALDLVFCIDTTGSMGSDINQVKVSAVSIVNLAKSEFSDLRVALVGYKDFPDEDSAYLYYDYQDFTTNLSDAVTAINTLTVGGGGDTPEAVYSALMHTFDGTSLGGWRPSPVARAVITMGDAPPHDPEPHTGYTLADIVNKSAAGGAETTLFLPSKRGASKNAATVETNVLSGPISVYPVWVGGDYSAGAAWTNIAGGTGGSVVKASSSSDVPQQMVNQIEAIKKATSASLGVLGPGGQTSVRGLTTVVADASKSYDPNGCGIVTYEWDWNFDGVYDETTVTPVVKHAYPGGLTNSIKVRVTSVGGDSATALFALPAASPETAAVLSATMTGSIDRQTGLYYEKVVVTNTGTAAVSGFRISVAGLPANVLFV